MPKGSVSGGKSNFVMYGAISALFACNDPEVLIEGPAGTGKSRGVLEKGLWLAERYRMARVLFARKTRASMSETILPIFEDEVLWGGSEALRGPGRHNRKFYTFRNGSIIVVSGLDEPSRILSGQYDLICVFQAEELSEDNWEMLIHRLRNGKIIPEGWNEPFSQLIGDVNPDAEHHWLNKRPDQIIDDPEHPRVGRPKMTRLLSRHTDNPRWWNHKPRKEGGKATTLTPEGKVYIARLRTLTGVRRDRYFLGKWVSAEGLVWPQFDSSIHVVDRWKEVRKGSKIKVVSNLPSFSWHFASVDWGFRRPGVLQVWGVTPERRIYRVAEIYARFHTDDWWADHAVELHKEYDIVRFVCDSAEPDRIEYWNHRLGTRGGRGLEPIAVGANKTVLTGIEHVRTLLDPEQKGGPSVFFVRDSLVLGKDKECVEDGLPTCTEEEIPFYTFKKVINDGAIVEIPDPKCEDHGADACRYACMWCWRKDLSEVPSGAKYKPGTIGAELGHEDIVGG